MTATLSPTPLTLEMVLRAGLRWLYVTEQPAGALVERRGARILTTDRALRFVPIASDGHPLIVVDILTAHWGVGVWSPPLNALPRDELPALANELVTLGIGSGALHYHGITGTIALDAPAHASLQAAVHRYDRGCPWHHTLVCEAPKRDGGQACSWHDDGHRRAAWPVVAPPPAPATPPEANASYLQPACLSAPRARAANPTASRLS